MFIGTIAQRFFHSSRVCLTTSGTSLLGKLRKTTGYSMSNCKKAVELFPGDIAKAEEWLHAEAKKQGWSKWAKIQARPATQGLVAVFSDAHMGVMVEVNCETDFVAKNEEFQQLVGKILQSCIHHIKPKLQLNVEFTKTVLDETRLNDIPHGASTVGDLVNSAVTKFGEKTVLKRAVCFSSVGTDNTICSLSHPTTQCPNLEGATLGKYGTLLAYRSVNLCPPSDEFSETVSNICQHIIGMNPSTIGELTDEDIKQFQSKINPEESPYEDIEKFQSKINPEESPAEVETKKMETKKEDTVQSSEIEGSAVDEAEPETEKQESEIMKETEETRLLFQPFLYDADAKVGEILLRDGCELIDFERFECGENLVENEEVKQAANSVV